MVWLACFLTSPRPGIDVIYPLHTSSMPFSCFIHTLFMLYSYLIHALYTGKHKGTYAGEQAGKGEEIPFQMSFSD
jgi:hypothetical protein